MVENRHQAGRVLPLVVAALTLLGGCFTGPINRPPEKPRIFPVGTVRRGEPASFRIDSQDPDDGDAFTVTWVPHSGMCPGDRKIPQDWDAPTLFPPATVGAEMTKEPFCICAVAVDSHGATSSDCLLVEPENGAPIADIKVLEPPNATSYPLYSSFKLSAVDSFDPIDQLLFSWTFTALAPSSHAVEIDCLNNPEHKQFCFTADVPGTYRVSVTVDDRHGGVSTKEQPLIVLEDRLPCIRDTKPHIVSGPLQPPQVPEFSVEVVDDDGEPYPQRPGRPAPHFAWSTKDGNEPWINLLGIDFHKLPVAPMQFAHGGLGQVRVEISDENPANQEMIRKQLATCLDAPECAAAPACLQRVTWTVEY